MNKLAKRPGTELARSERSSARHSPAAVYLSRLSPGTSRPTMEAALHLMAKLATAGRRNAFTCPWHELGYQETQALRTKLAEKFATATINKHLSALRQVLKEAWRLGLMGAEAYQRAADLKPATGSTLPAGREVSGGELEQLFAACDGGMKGRRDAAALALLYSTGMRRSEAVRLTLGDYDQELGSLRVLGKGNKARLVYLQGAWARTVEKWLLERGRQPGPLLCPLSKTGVRYEHMTPAGLLEVLKALQLRAGVAAFSPHDMRRTFVSHMLAEGADISLVQKLAGHSNVSTTQRYDRRDEDAKRQAVRLLRAPAGL